MRKLTPEHIRLRARIRRGFAGAGIALLLGCLSPVCAAPAPNAADAHVYLADLFQRYAVEYAVWYGRRTTDNYHGRFAGYVGTDCRSELRLDRTSASGYAVDWSVISSIESSGPLGIYVIGQIGRAPESAGRRRFTSFHLYFPDAVLRQRAHAAFELLRGSCRKRSLFD